MLLTLSHSRSLIQIKYQRSNESYWKTFLIGLCGIFYFDKYNMKQRYRCGAGSERARNIKRVLDFINRSGYKQSELKKLVTWNENENVFDFTFKEEILERAFHDVKSEKCATGGI
jgi:hypothetical protein